MAKPRAKNGSNWPKTQTRGLTQRQKDINKKTGVDNSYNYKQGAARDSARTFAEAELAEALKSGDKNRIKAARNVLRRKTMGGKGG